MIVLFLSLDLDQDHISSSQHYFPSFLFTYPHNNLTNKSLTVFFLCTRHIRQYNSFVQFTKDIYSHVDSVNTLSGTT